MTYGVYIHIPFCETRCNYCHFVTRPMQTDTAERYRRAVVDEIRMYWREQPCPEPVDSIYFGGGTPSLVPPDHLADMIALCRGLCDVTGGCEISLEANPDTIRPETVAAYVAMGVNRISIGAQSFEDDELSAIGRLHDSRQVEEAVATARACGLSNINLDLMLGLPGQDRRKWLNGLERVAALEPPHLSVYMLDLEPRSPLHHAVVKGLHRLPGDDLVSDLYLETLEFLGRCGYGQYEISNFALPGFRCRHNLKYWLRLPVAAFGVSSHSFDGAARRANLSNMNAYLNSVEAGRAPWDWHRAVTPAERLSESLFLGLRLNQGIDLQGVRLENPEVDAGPLETVLRDLATTGLVQIDGYTVRLTPAGMLVSNEIFQQFV